MAVYEVTEIKYKSIKTLSGYLTVPIARVGGTFDIEGSGSLTVDILFRAPYSFTAPILFERYGNVSPLPDKWGESEVDVSVNGSYSYITVGNRSYYVSYDYATVFPIFLDNNGNYLPTMVGGLNPSKVIVYTPPTSSSYGVAVQASNSNNYGWVTNTDKSVFRAEVALWNSIMSGAEDPDEDPYSELDGTADLPGGSSINLPGLPTFGATSTGIIGLFAPNESQMRDLADYMWTDFGGSGSTVEDFLQEIVQALKRMTADPLDYILGLNVIPSRGLSVGALSNIRFGFLGSTGVSMPRLASQYFEVDCGSITFDTVCGNTFLDYAPYSKFSLYLPYVGFVDVDPNDFVGHTMGVKYHGDVVSGAIVAYVTKDGSVMYQYSGNCAVNIPLSSDNWGATFSAAVGVASSIITPAALPAALKEGSIGTAVAGSAAKRGIASTVASVASNPSLLSPSIRHSGTVAGTAGAMGVQVPFVIREAVSFHSTRKFNTLNGYPSYYYRRLSEVSGFTSVIGVHIEGSSATAEEIAEIEELLIGGVIL